MRSINALGFVSPARRQRSIDRIDVAPIIAFTKALRSTTLITNDGTRPIYRHLPRLCPHIQTVFAAGRSIDHGSGARRLSPRHEETIRRLAFISKRRNPHETRFSNLAPRRGFAATAATTVATIGLLGATSQSAKAYQGNMEHALASLRQALQSLQEATANKGGHRARAAELVRQAIEETEAGVAFADEHGGGGH